MPTVNTNFSTTLYHSGHAVQVISGIWSLLLQVYLEKCLTILGRCLISPVSGLSVTPEAGTSVNPELSRKMPWLMSFKVISGFYRLPIRCHPVWTETNGRPGFSSQQQSNWNWTITTFCNRWLSRHFLLSLCPGRLSDSLAKTVNRADDLWGR